MPVYDIIRQDTGEPISRRLDLEEYAVAKVRAREAGNPWCMMLDIGGREVLCSTDWSRRRQNARPGNWPLRCDAAGVSPEQIPHAISEAAKQGVRIDFTSDGRAIFESARHRKAYCEARGRYDRNGGYSDPQYHGRLSEDG